jgi:ribosomal protein S18 acetylase RimI-like enzyme
VSPDGVDATPAREAAEFTIRMAEPADFRPLGQITLAAYGANRDDLGAAYRRELRDVGARAAACPVLVAVRADGRLLGGVTYVPGPGNPFSELERDGEAGIRMLAVDPVAQGLGVGRALTIACLERARDEGRTGVALYTRPANAPAQRLYETLGFVRDPDRDWEYEPGHWLWAFALAF